MKRMTKQRMAILKSLSDSKRPLYVEEILSKAAEEAPKINLSTVYRTIRALVEEEKISLIELPGEKSCYEISNKGHHHYFLCDGCSEIYVLNKCPKGLADMIPEGFNLMGHSITLNGFCLECNG